MRLDSEVMETNSPPLVAQVTAPVTVLWRSADSPRAVDAPVVADAPDHGAWLAAMDAAGTGDASRWGLLDRIDSQVVEGEPVIVTAASDGWSQVVCPWQPSKGDPRGYPGWIRTAHLSEPLPAAGAFDRVAESVAGASATAVIETALSYVGLAYLWGGVSETAMDCSGLVHLSCRAHGLIVPRDGDDQVYACDPVEPGTERIGDLYFFADPGKPITHVGFSTGPMRMLHAPGTGQGIIDEPMPQDRKDTLVQVGRIRGLS